MSTRPAAQAARNEDIFRELNEHLEAASSGDSGSVRSFVCECSDISCSALLAVPLADYERVRRDSKRFIVAPSQEHVSTIEHVVERCPTFWIVEKTGIAGDVAEALDDKA